MNVLRLSILATSLLLLSGCSILPGWKTVEPIQIQKKAVERTRLNIGDPPAPKTRAPKWIVITPENAEQVWKDLKEKNVDLVVIGLTDEGYEDLAITIAELRNYMANQRAVIIKYREYYEPKVTTDGADQNKN